MPLPVPDIYLATALEPEVTFQSMTLRHQPIGDIVLPSGRLIACDPFGCFDAVPFDLQLPSGTFPVILSIANFRGDERPAFAVIRFRETPPVTWEMLGRGGQDPSTLRPDEIFGYAVDTGVGCFMAPTAARAVVEEMGANKAYFKRWDAEFEKTYVHTRSWLNLPYGDGNLVAFSSGDGDGVYATYAGRDETGAICAVVTDFALAPLPTHD